MPSVSSDANASASAWPQSIAAAVAHRFAAAGERAWPVADAA